MKNIFNINHKNSSKPAAYFIIFLIVIAFAASLIGCGSDNPVNNGGNNPPAETVMLHIDSITVNPVTISGIDTIFNIPNNDIDSLKIEFTAETNTTQSMNPFISINIKDTVNTFFSVGCQDLSEFHSYTLYTATRNIDYKIEIMLFISQAASSFHYVKLKNLHITKFQ